VHHLRAASLPRVQAVRAADLGEVERHLWMDLQVPRDRAQLRGADGGLTMNVLFSGRGGALKRPQGDQCRQSLSRGLIGSSNGLE
jgi:hypothetical protein